MTSAAERCTDVYHHVTWTCNGVYSSFIIAASWEVRRTWAGAEITEPPAMIPGNRAEKAVHERLVGRSLLPGPTMCSVRVVVGWGGLCVCVGWGSLRFYVEISALHWFAFEEGERRRREEGEKIRGRRRRARETRKRRRERIRSAHGKRGDADEQWPAKCWPRANSPFPYPPPATMMPRKRKHAEVRYWISFPFRYISHPFLRSSRSSGHLHTRVYASFCLLVLFCLVLTSYRIISTYSWSWFFLVEIARADESSIRMCFVLFVHVSFVVQIGTLPGLKRRQIRSRLSFHSSNYPQSPDRSHFSSHVLFRGLRDYQTGNRNNYCFFNINNCYPWSLLLWSLIFFSYKAKIRAIVGARLVGHLFWRVLTRRWPYLTWWSMTDRLVVSAVVYDFVGFKGQGQIWPQGLVEQVKQSISCYLNSRMLLCVHLVVPIRLVTHTCLCTVFCYFKIIYGGSVNLYAKLCNSWFLIFECWKFLEKKTTVRASKAAKIKQY